MESELKPEVKEGLENPTVNWDSKAKETNNMLTNANDPTVESVAELCEIYGYELATSDLLIESDHIPEDDSNLPLQPSQQTDGIVVIPPDSEKLKVAEESESAEELKLAKESEVAEKLKVAEVSDGAEESDAGEVSEATEELKVADESDATEVSEATQQLKKAKGSEGDRKAAECPTTGSAVHPNEDNDSVPTSLSDNVCVPRVEDDPQSFMNRLNSKLATWKDCERVSPPEIEQIIRKVEPASSTTSSQVKTCLSDAQKTQKLKLDLKGEELRTFRELRKIGVPREAAWARIQESRAKFESCREVNVRKYSQTVQANLAASRPQKMTLVQKTLSLVKQQKQERAKIFNKFNKKQMVLYSELREKHKNVSHPDAMSKVIEMSGKLGIINIGLANLLNAKGPGTSITDGTTKSTSGDSTVSHCQQPIDGSKSVAEFDGIGECCERYPEYSDFFFGLFRDPKCKHSLLDIMHMAERIPEGHGIFARKLFVLRCYQLGVDPDGWDWKQYSEIPPVPKILKVPRTLQNRTVHRQTSKPPSCRHSSCKYYLSPLENQHRPGSSKAESAGMRKDSFGPNFKNPHNSGLPPLMALGEPGPSSYEKRKNSFDEYREVKRSMLFVENPSADFLSAGTQPTQGLRLFIIPNRYPSEVLDDGKMYEIENAILRAILQIPDERMRPYLDGSFHNNGRYEVICRDQFSKEWFCKYITCLLPDASLEVVTADLRKTGVVRPACNINENRESRYSHEPGYAMISTHDSQERGSTERSLYADPLPQAHPSFSKRNLQDRLGPKVENAYDPQPSLHCQDERRMSGSYSPCFIDEPSEHAPSWEASSSSARIFHERIRVEVTSPVESRYVESSQHDGLEVRVSKSRYCGYSDGGEHSGYVESSGYTQPGSSYRTYRNSLEGYDLSLVVTRNRSPECNRSGYIEPRWHGETLSDHYSSRSAARRHSESLSPEYSNVEEYRASRNRSEYYESGDSLYGAIARQESQSDARENLMRIRTNRTSSNYRERGGSPSESSHTFHTGFRERLRSPPPYSKSADRTSRSKYNPSRQCAPTQSHSHHFSEH